jgi:NADP-dependent 3-hydroxy acid dehydrogenase YdfG
MTDPDSVDAFAARIDDCRVLANNAGGALGLEPVADSNDDRWRLMYEANVLGTARVNARFCPRSSARKATSSW